MAFDHSTCPADWRYLMAANASDRCLPGLFTPQKLVHCVRVSSGGLRAGELRVTLALDPCARSWARLPEQRCVLGMPHERRAAIILIFQAMFLDQIPKVEDVPDVYGIAAQVTVILLERMSEGKVETN